MKHGIQISLLMVMGLMFMFASSCKKDDKVTATAPYFFNCKVNGVAFVGKTTGSDIDGAGSGSANISGSQYNTLNLKSSNFTLYASNLGTKGAGVYDSASYSNYIDEDGNLWSYKSGSFVVTKYDAVKSEVSGTFTSMVFEYDSLTITATDGSFCAYLIK